MSRRRRPKFQPQSGVPARCKGSLAAQMGQRRRADPTLSCTSAGRGLVTDEVAARVSFTVETTVLPSFALRKPWEGSSSSHDPSLSREAALSYSMVGMSRRRRPKFQPQSGVPAQCKGSLAAQMGQRRRADPTLSCTSAGRGLVTDEVAARVSFTVETTVLPSFALRKLGRVHRPRMTQTSAAKQRLCGRG